MYSHLHRRIFDHIIPIRYTLIQFHLLVARLDIFCTVFVIFLNSWNYKRDILVIWPLVTHLMPVTVA